MSTKQVAVHRTKGSNRLMLKIFGGGLLLLAFHLPGFVLRESIVAAKILSDALAGLSETALREYDFI